MTQIKFGKYNLELQLKDSSGNEASEKFVLNIVEKVPKESTSKKKEVLFSDSLTNYKKENTSLGIDVSKWQGDINWTEVKNAGAEFTFIRVGTQEGFDKENAEDKYFEKNIKEAIASDIQVGVYFHSYAKTTEEAITQADWVYEKIKEYDVKLPVVFDWESWSSFSKCNMSFYDINHIARTFIDRLESYGYKGALYGSKNYLEKIWNTNEFENIWLAHYTNNTNYVGKYDFWQMCETGRIDGIKENVDIDIWYK